MASIEALGRFALARDLVPPTLALNRQPEGGQDMEAVVGDAGSGIDPAALAVRADGALLPISFDGARLRWTVPVLAGAAAVGQLEVVVADRAGNTARQVVPIVTGRAGLPRGTCLGHGYPNPFNPATTIPFDLAAVGVLASATVPVTLSVYDLAGQLVRPLVAGALAPGHHEVRWDGRDRTGAVVGSGVYLCRLEAPDGTWTRRLTLLK